MRLLDRYIGSCVIWGSGLALMVFVGLLSFTEFLDDLNSVGKGNYTVWRAIEYMLLTLPRNMYELFPMAALVGSLLGLGLLSTNRELMVIRAAGVSIGRIILSVMKTGALLMVFALLVGEVIAPFCESLGKERRSLALSDQITLRAGEGLWIRDGTSFINIREVLPEDQMADIFIYEFDEGQELRATTYAANAFYEEDVWRLEGIKQSLIGVDAVEKRHIDQAAWDSVFEPDLVDVITVKPESLSAIGLLRYLDYLRENGLSTVRYELALWGKVMSPLATGVMIFLAVPLVLGRLRDVGVGQRILVGILVGIVYHVTQQTAVQMGIVYGLTPFASAAAPTLFFLGVGIVLLKRIN